MQMPQSTEEPQEEITIDQLIIEDLANTNARLNVQIAVLRATLMQKEAEMGAKQKEWEAAADRLAEQIIELQKQIEPKEQEMLDAAPGKPDHNGRTTAKTEKEKKSA